MNIAPVFSASPAVFGQQSEITLHVVSLRPIYTV